MKLSRSGPALSGSDLLKRNDGDTSGEVEPGSLRLGAIPSVKPRSWSQGEPGLLCE